MVRELTQRSPSSTSQACCVVRMRPTGSRLRRNFRRIWSRSGARGCRTAEQTPPPLVGRQGLSLGRLQVIIDPIRQFDCSSSHLRLWRHLDGGQVRAGVANARPVLENGSRQRVGRAPWCESSSSAPSACAIRLHAARSARNDSASTAASVTYVSSEWRRATIRRSTSTSPMNRTRYQSSIRAIGHIVIQRNGQDGVPDLYARRHTGKHGSVLTSSVQKSQASAKKSRARAEQARVATRESSNTVLRLLRYSGRVVV
jgi:hypothetical protein